MIDIGINPCNNVFIHNSHWENIMRRVKSNKPSNLKKVLLGVVLGFLCVSSIAGAALASYGYRVQDRENAQIDIAFKINKLNMEFDANHRQFLSDAKDLKELYSSRIAYEKLGLADGNLHQLCLERINITVAEMQQLDKTQDSELKEIAELQNKLEMLK